jgi:hypothetical protein
MPVRRSADNPILWAYRKDRDYTQMARTMQEWLEDELFRPDDFLPSEIAEATKILYRVERAWG